MHTYLCTVAFLELEEPLVSVFVAEQRLAREIGNAGLPTAPQLADLALNFGPEVR